MLLPCPPNQGNPSESSARPRPTPTPKMFGLASTHAKILGGPFLPRDGAIVIGYLSGLQLAAFGDGPALANHPRTVGIRVWHEPPAPRNPGQFGHPDRYSDLVSQLRHRRHLNRTAQSRYLSYRASATSHPPIIHSNNQKPLPVYHKLSTKFIGIPEIYEPLGVLFLRPPPLLFHEKFGRCFPIYHRILCQKRCWLSKTMS
jgi:hypothetical protein